jgi:ABC-type sugar transport system permease subunit
MILTLAALQSIPNEVRESAKVEGASPWQELRHVTLPLIKNTLLVALIILTVNAINMVDLPLVMTGGGPVSATDLLGLRVYREAFTLEHIGFASAISMVMFLINIVVSLVYIRVVREDTK